MAIHIEDNGAQSELTETDLASATATDVAHAIDKSFFAASMSTLAAFLTLLLTALLLGVPTAPTKSVCVAPLATLPSMPSQVSEDGSLMLSPDETFGGCDIRLGSGRPT